MWQKFLSARMFRPHEAEDTYSSFVIIAKTTKLYDFELENEGQCWQMRYFIRVY